MLKINFEFRKGIFFLRLIGEMTQNNYEMQKEIKELLINNKFKYIVINTNYLEQVDLVSLNYLIELFYITKNNNCNLIICDKFSILERLLGKNIPNIKDEIEVL